MDPRSFQRAMSSLVALPAPSRSRSRVLLTTVIRFFLRAGLDGTVLLIIFFSLIEVTPWNVEVCPLWSIYDPFVMLSLRYILDSAAVVLPLSL